MRATTMRAAFDLADQVAARVRAAGRRPPDRAELVAAMVPSARQITRAARWLNAAIDNCNAAKDHAVEVAATARADVERVTAEWLAQAPELVPDDVAFEQIAARLADVDQAAGDLP